MSAQISVGDEAPNFDLSSTEDALLMLKDEVPRKTVVLYFTADPETERSRQDLLTLARKHREDSPKLHTRILVVSPKKVPALKKLQAELGLPFPLLCDDRDFSTAYGVEPGPDGTQPPPALVVVNCHQRVLYLANPVSSVEGALAEVNEVLKQQPSPSEGYPRRVVNGLVDWWVN